MEILDAIEIEQSPKKYAGFLIRVVAAIIDSIILSLVAWIVFSIAGVNIFIHVWSIRWYGNIIWLLYYILMESSAKQATIGKQITGIKVVDKDGGRISAGQSAIRSVAKIISATILLIGFIMVAFDYKKRGLHDIIAGTFVVMEK